MRIGREHFNPESGAHQDGQNFVVQAILAQLKANINNEDFVAEDIRVEGISRIQVGNALKDMEGRGFLEKKSVRKGDFSISRYKLTREGEGVHEASEGIDPVLVERDLATTLLLEAVELDKPFAPSLLDTSEDRQGYIINFLKRVGLLEESRIHKGAFSIAGISITEKGKLFLQALDSTIQPDTSDIKAEYTGLNS